MSTYKYWYFEDALSNRFCDEVIKHGLNQRDSQAAVGNQKGENVKALLTIRNSNIAWLNDPWIYKEIHPYIYSANESAGWNYDWDYSESCQFTKYKLNQHYDWHCDIFPLPTNRPNTPQHGKVRKLSASCQLTDSSKYEGGELEFDFRDYNPSKRNKLKHVVQPKAAFKKGSIIVFPSWLWHRVKPVTKGERYSLVIWNIGYPFR